MQNRYIFSNIGGRYRQYLNNLKVENSIFTNLLINK